MKPSGMRLVKVAKGSSACTFLDDVDKLIIPPDLANALESHDKAAQNLKANHPEGRDAGPAE